MSGKVFNKVKGVIHGIIPFVEVQSITFTQGAEEILAKGDDDLIHDGQALKTLEFTGSINTKDISLGKQNGSLVGGANQATLVFVVIDETSGGNNQEFTLSNTMLFPPELSAESDGDGDVFVYNFRAVSSDGQTSPLAQADE